jgi:hypothetical protein
VNLVEWLERMVAERRCRDPKAAGDPAFQGSEAGGPYRACWFICSKTSGYRMLFETFFSFENMKCVSKFPFDPTMLSIAITYRSSSLPGICLLKR